MTRNKSLLIIVFFLIVSILVAIYFQFLLVGKIYLDKKKELRDNFIDLLEHSIVLVEETKTTNKLSHEDIHNDILLFIIKVSHDELKMNEYEFNDFLKSEIDKKSKYIIDFQGGDLVEIKKNLERSIEKEKLKAEYKINYYKNLSYKQFSSVFDEADLLISYSFGFFTIKFKNENSFFISEMINVLLSSFFFIVTMIFCGTLLVIKYLKEKKLSNYKNEFINNLTHELQTPLTVSRLALEKLNIDLKKDNKYVSIIKKENTKIEKLTKRILKLAEIKTVVLSNEKIDFEKAIKKIIERYKPIIKEEDTVITDLNHMAVKLKGNKDLFLDMLDNLVGNAIKYSNSPRIIIIKTNIRNRNFFLSIKDNGIGIPKEFEDKIFTPFFKVPNNDTHEIRSHGLGLSCVAAIVKQMKGTITISSKLSKETTFNITLPYEN